MRKLHRAWLSSLALCASLGVMGATARDARAQTAQGWALNRFDPAPVGDPFFIAEHPWTTSVRRVAVGFYLDYASNPLVQQSTFSDGRIERTAVISGMLSGHVGLAYSFADRVGLNVSLPLSLSQRGTAETVGSATVAPAESVSLGDIRVGFRVRLFNHADRDPVSLHFGANAYIPSGSRESNTGDGSFRVEPRLTVAGRGGPIRWSLGAAAMLRGALDVYNLGVGHEARLTAAVGVVALNDRLTVGPEAYVMTSLSDRPLQGGGGSALFETDHWGGEALLGAHYLIADKVLVGAGGGVGFQPGYGIPAARGIFTLAWAPVNRSTARDTDGDGVLDPDDQCPDVPQGDHPDPARRGCPAGDRDADGVLDHEDQCVDVPQGEHPDPARRGCPEGDRDSDGVLDSADQCVDVPAGPRPSQVRRGCPALDADHDNILDPPDGPDQCPDRPETFNGVNDEDGCPDGVALAEQNGSQIRILQQVNFRTDSDVITGGQSFHVLDAVVSILRAMPQVTSVDVQGHTDDRGSAAHNRDLSNRRAASVVRYLTEHGIDAGRLQSHGFGPDCPLQRGRNAAAWAANRRVQFVIVGPESPAGQCSTQPVTTVVPGR